MVTSPASRPHWPIFQSMRGLSAAGLGRDLLAGLTLAAIAIPEQMATARLGGFTPEQGFFAFVAATLGFAAFGASGQLSAGADTTITPIFAGAIALLAAAGSPQYAALSIALALMVGGIVLFAGLFKLGWIADLLSVPVITGFLAGISLHIVLSQTPAVLGLPEESGNTYRRLAQLGAQIGGFNALSVAVGVGAFAVTLIVEKLAPKVPGALIAVVGAAAATAALGLDRRGVAVLGHVQGGFPSLALPAFSFGDMLRLVSLAFIVALAVMVQTAATTRAFGGDGEDPDINRDYVGVGAANLLAGLFGAFPVNASPPRTSIVASAGGRSQCAGLSAAMAVLLLAAFGARLLAYVPTAALAGILLFVAQRIFHAAIFADLLRRTPAEFALAALTMVLIIALPIQTGVAIGMFLSLAQGVFTITRTQPIAFERVADTTVWWPEPTAQPGVAEHGVLVMGFQAPLSFLNAYDFRRGMLSAIARAEGSAKVFILEASSIVEIDFTASKVIADVIGAARAAGMDFAVARLESVRAQSALERFGIIQLLGKDHLFQTVDAAIRALGPR